MFCTWHVVGVLMMNWGTRLLVRWSGGSLDRSEFCTELCILSPTHVGFTAGEIKLLLRSSKAVLDTLELLLLFVNNLRLTFMFGDGYCMLDHLQMEIMLKHTL